MSQYSLQDMHPGNIFVLSGDVICLLDFGMAGIVDRQTRDDFVDLVDSIVHQNEIRAAQVFAFCHQELPFFYKIGIYTKYK